ncbi:MAG: hypothetical protein HW377_1287 [Actinobacteria bacterium]|nr:hypothetical protein [Actinomycetota bacterium]
MLIDLYVAYTNKDFWGVVAVLGEDALCAVASIMTSNTVDVCGLIKELAQLAEDLLDAGKAVAKFFAAFGEGALDVGKDITCATVGLGCDDSPPPPPEYYAYEYVFAPNVPAGVKKIEESSSAFVSFQLQLEKNALAKPAAKLSKGYPFPLSFDKGPVNHASKMFSDAVDAGWTKDIATNVLPALAKKRNEYGTSQKIAELAKNAAATVKNETDSPGNDIGDLCAKDFTTTGFEHVDRWIADQKHQKDVASLKAIKHGNWCVGPFWSGNKEKFAQQFESFVQQANLCPPSGGGKYRCPNIEKYRKCLGILGSVDRKDQCGVNMAVAGQEAAARIQDGFAKGGSKIPCKIEKSLSSPGSVSPSVRLVCTRPTQKLECEKYYKSYFGIFPVTLMTCKFDEDPKYKVLKEAVKKAAGELTTAYGAPFDVGPIDPLAVHTPSTEIWEKIQKGTKQDFGFGPPSAKPGFDYVFSWSKTIDGLSTPQLWYAADVSKMTTSPAVQSVMKKMDLVKPGDPDPFGKASSSLGSPGALQAAPGVVYGPTMPKGLEGSASTPMQGKLPATGERTASPRDARPTASAEIRSGPSVMVAGKYPAVWGQGVSVSEADARRAAGGVCDVTVKHDAVNAGAAASGPFARRWVNNRNPAPFTDTYPPIPAGGMEPRTDTLPLKPGANELTLTLDPLDQVKESNETNNVYRVTITVSGGCGAAGTPPPGVTSPGSAPPAGRPGTRGR